MAFWIWSVPPEHLSAYLRTGTFALRHQGRRALADVRPGDRIFAYLPGTRVVAALVEATSAAFEDRTPLVPGGAYPFRVRVRPLVALPEEAWVPAAGFAASLRVLEEYARMPTPELRFRAVVQRVLHRLPALDGKVLEFLVYARQGADPEALMAAVEEVRRARAQELASPRAPKVAEAPPAYEPASPADRAAALEALIEALAARGFIYDPSHVAAFVTALRTKPFVILAGVTGVGKSRLPQLVMEATGGSSTLIPVRPDWTDPAEALGYRDLQGRFRPGVLLRAARAATDDPRRFHLAVLDEMNLGRPEQYLAEVLSRMEARQPAPGGWASPPLLSEGLAPADVAWQGVRLAPNFALVGTVNVDESAHPLSRKVLDRAFTLELDAADLGRWSREAPVGAAVNPWPPAAWAPRAVRLGELGDLSAGERATVEAAVAALTEADALLAPAGLGVGYRARDEAALFCLHAAETPGAFRASDGAAVAPLDLALGMKLLPRLEGSRRGVRQAVFSLLGWATDGRPRHDSPPRFSGEADAAALLDVWEGAGRPAALADARFPRMAARLARIADGLLVDGFASFWG